MRYEGLELRVQSATAPLNIMSSFRRFEGRGERHEAKN